MGHTDYVHSDKSGANTTGYVNIVRTLGVRSTEQIM